MTILFNDQTTNATSDNYPGGAANPDLRHPGGPVQIAMTGTFDGAEVFVNLAQGDLPFVTLTETDFVAPDVNGMSMAAGSRLQIVISGAGASTSISVDVAKIT